MVVDFWAPWCGPCRVLGPLLEKLVGEFGGAFILAKVNSDESPSLAARYGVRGIPNVQVFKDGRVVDRFVGALPEHRVREFLRANCPSEADRLVDEGRRLGAAGDREGARRSFEQALAQDPRHAAAHLELARMALQDGEPDALERHAAAVPYDAAERAQADSLREAGALVREAGAAEDEETLRRRVEADPGDLEGWYALGARAITAGRHRDALDAFLNIAEADRKWRDEAARKAMLTVFGLVGVRSPLADEYRHKLMFIY